MFPRSTLHVLAAAVLCFVSPVRADDYDVLASAFKGSSAEINKMKFPDLIYSLDEGTARGYFQRYFAENRMTAALAVNLGYPVFFWGNNQVNLQKAVAAALVGELTGFFKKHATPDAMQSAFAADGSLHDHVFFALGFLASVAGSDKLDLDFKRGLRQQVYDLLKASGLADPRRPKLGKAKFSLANSVKLQLMLTAYSLAKDTDDFSGLAQAVGLAGARKSIFDKYTVLVLDNEEFDAKQLSTINAYLASMPSFLRIPLAITCVDNYLDPAMNKRVTVHSFRSAGSFNIFGLKVGAAPENQFPGDYKAVETDIFTIVLAHEYNHNVDAVCLKNRPELVAYKERLLQAAGGSHNNYLRSMFDDNFFAKSPQEFIASIANEYFCSSRHTLQYALDRAKKGNLNPINQFALMASIYSDATNAFFYTISRQGDVKRDAYPVKKEKDLVTSLVVGLKTFQFRYADGMIDKVETLTGPAAPR